MIDLFIIFFVMCQGLALVFAPRRGKTLSLFCELAQQAGLHVFQQQQYDTQVMDLHLKVWNLSHLNRRWKKKGI